MDFKFSAADEAFRQEFRSWLEKHLPHDWRDDGELHDPDTKEEFERRRAWHRQLYDGGWMCIYWPREDRGGRAGPGGRSNYPPGNRPAQGPPHRQFFRGAPGGSHPL